MASTAFYIDFKDRKPKVPIRLNMFREYHNELEHENPFQTRGHIPDESSQLLVGFNVAFCLRFHISKTVVVASTKLFPSVMKFAVNFCQTLTLLSPPCSLPCCSLSACQNNEGKRNAAFGGPESGQPAQCPHEYSVLHMALCIRICIHLKALIRTLDLNTRGCGCCQRAS